MEWFPYVCSLASLIVACITIFSKAAEPSRKTSERIDQLEDKIDQLKDDLERYKRDTDAQISMLAGQSLDQQELNILILETMQIQLNEQDGSEAKEQAKKIQQFLIKKGGSY